LGSGNMEPIHQMIITIKPPGLFCDENTKIAFKTSESRKNNLSIESVIFNISGESFSIEVEITRQDWQSL